MTSERLGQTVRKRGGGETNISARFICDPGPPSAFLQTLRWVEPTGPVDWDDIGFDPADYTWAGSGIYLFPEGSQGDYLLSVSIEATAADGTVLVQWDDLTGVFEKDAVPASEGFARLNLATVHRFFYWDDNPLGGNVGFSVGLYPFSVTGDVEVVGATLTITKLRAI